MIDWWQISIAGLYMCHCIMFSLHSLNYTAANLSNMSLKFTCSVVAKKAPLKVSCRVTLTFWSYWWGMWHVGSKHSLSWFFPPCKFYERSLWYKNILRAQQFEWMWKVESLTLGTQQQLLPSHQSNKINMWQDLMTLTNMFCSLATALVRIALKIESSMVPQQKQLYVDTESNSSIARGFKYLVIYLQYSRKRMKQKCKNK